MKTKIEEQDASHQLLSVNKSRGRRRGKRKSRSALPEGSKETSPADHPPASQSGDVTSQCDGVTSYSEGVTPEASACETCRIQTRNAAQLAAHLSSKRHARRRRELRILAALSDTAEVTEAADKAALAARLARGNAGLETPAPLKDKDLPDCITRKCEGKIRQRVSYSCGLCGIQLTSLGQVQQHLVSRRHSALQEGRPPPVRTDRHSARKARTKAAVKQSWFW